MAGNILTTDLPKDVSVVAPAIRRAEVMFVLVGRTTEPQEPLRESWESWGTRGCCDFSRPGLPGYS